MLPKSELSRRASAPELKPSDIENPDVIRRTRKQEKTREHQEAASARVTDQNDYNDVFRTLSRENRVISHDNTSGMPVSHSHHQRDSLAMASSSAMDSDREHFASPQERSKKQDDRKSREMASSMAAGQNSFNDALRMAVLERRVTQLERHNTGRYTPNEGERRDLEMGLDSEQRPDNRPWYRSRKWHNSTGNTIASYLGVIGSAATAAGLYYTLNPKSSGSPS
jgi:hypothetical protein